MRLYRVILPVPDTEAGARFYARLFGQEGERIAENRHYFDCGIVVAVVGPGGRATEHPMPDYCYFAVEDLEQTLVRAREAGATIEKEIDTYPWGERSFYVRDPWGNPLCFVDDSTLFTGGRFVP
ncbi:MAG: VOC family protein [Dehalococcoidia bacterium]|nr:VOC family protein [Dehalococcoidia bacterium]MCA9855287.1 VOC family protein [Dehalococcoidia bacterium]